MHASHIETIKTFKANLRHAILTKSSANVGGGEFSPSELNSVMLALEWVLARQDDADKKHD